ncbi:YggT family protein [Tumebacillus lipolyticus]|uniref:YggT family protein n=1 Tax=Tumebacillus lipolyticus TaxID=1280370 RepID=A0ABW4ZYP9_9BACL
MVYQIISYVLLAMKFYTYVLIARVLMSWVPDVERTSFGRVLYRITEPYLGIFRRFIPPLPLGGGYMDFSPIIAIFAWSFVIEGVAIVLKWLFL